MPAGQPTDPRAPERPTVAGIKRDMDRALGQFDRRIPSAKDPEAIVKYRGGQRPARKPGRMWLQDLSTGEMTPL